MYADTGLSFFRPPDEHIGAGRSRNRVRMCLLAGFVVGGTGTETLLLGAGIGLGLSAFGLTGVLANPQLTPVQ